MAQKRKQVKVLVTMSVAADVTAAEARRELRTRVNEGCCYSRDEEEVRVRKIESGRGRYFTKPARLTEAV